MMKNFFVSALVVMLAGSSLYSCIGKNDVSIHVTDSTGKLRIKVEANKHGKDIFYDETFDVANYTKAEKSELVKHITDSLGVAD
ncbi:hypothetical protein BH11BAC3_BH11BAC3_28140 [soil metagenome]